MEEVTILSQVQDKFHMIFTFLQREQIMQQSNTNIQVSVETIKPVLQSKLNQ